MTQPRIAVIGCGAWGMNHVRNFSDHGVLSAVCDGNPEVARSVAEQFNVPALDLDLALTNPDLDGVVIAAPAVRHADLAEAALNEGKHVLVEKPLALSVDAAERVCAAAGRNNRVLMVGHLLRYHPAFQRLESLVESGELGAIRFISSTRLNLGKIRQEEDILWSFAPHDISMILALLGEEPIGVSANGTAYLSSGIADVTTTDLTFANGARANIFVSWLHPYKEQKLVVVGEDGMAVFDDTETWDGKLAIYRHRIDWIDGAPHPIKADGERVAVTEGEPLTLETRHFLDCIADDQQPLTDGREGLRVLRVLAAAAQSMNARGIE